MNISEYEYLWTTEKQNWVLVKTEYGDAIVNKATQSALLISDDELEKAVIERMRSEGCKTYENIRDAFANA